MKKRKIIILLSVLIFLFLSGCDPCNPMGFRQFGTIKNNANQNKKFIAIEHYYGICSYHSFSTTDGGFTWNPDLYSYDDINFPSEDCTKSCEFADPLNDQILYQIVPGKTLLRSTDGGNTWNEELRILDWNQMQKNYVNYKFAEIGSIPRDIRGPFGAVTDPQTGNLIVAMGFEGMLVRPANNQWTWVDDIGFGEVQPSRFEMLGLILPQEWVKGLFIALFLMLNGLGRIGLYKWRFLSTVFLLLAFWIILIPFEANELIVSLALPWEFQRLLDMLILGILTPLLVGFGLIVIILMILKSHFSQNRSLIIQIAKLSTFGTFGYWLAFILWSQGILPVAYGFAFLIGFFLFIVTLGAILHITDPEQAKEVRGAATG